MAYYKDKKVQPVTLWTVPGRGRPTVLGKIDLLLQLCWFVSLRLRLTVNAAVPDELGGGGWQA